MIDQFAGITEAVKNARDIFEKVENPLKCWRINAKICFENDIVYFSYPIILFRDIFSFFTHAYIYKCISTKDLDKNLSWTKFFVRQNFRRTKFSSPAKKFLSDENFWRWRKFCPTNNLVRRKISPTFFSDKVNQLENCSFGKCGSISTIECL